ncbi:MAG: toll/interleukin-1 receptor domain-containing protein [Chloroflexota bacterium]
MSHIFISYSRKDLAIARPIVAALAQDGLDVWIDWDDIPKGEELSKEIYHGIEESDAFLFLVSPDSVQSEWCNKEIEYAAKNGKRILPIAICNTDPKSAHPEISKRLWISCREEQDDFEKAIEEARKTIHTDYEWLKYHTELQVKALRWEQKKDASRLLRGKELREAEQRLADISSQEDPQLTKTQREYILASQRNEVRTRRQITLSLGVGLAIVASLAVFAWNQRNNALNSEATAVAESNAKAIALVNEENARATAEAERTRAEEQALIANSRHLASVAQTELDTRTDLALLLSAESAKKNQNFSTLDGLLSILNYEPVPYTFFFRHKKPVSALSFSRDNQYVASASEDHTICIWNRLSGQVEEEINVEFTATALGFSPDNKYLVVGLDDTVRTWDIKKSDWMDQFYTGHNARLTGFAFDPGGDKLAVSYEDGKILLFNFNSANLILTIDAPDRVDGLAFNSNGSTLAGGYAVDVFTWETRTGELLKSYYEFGGFAEGLRFDSNDELYAYGSWQDILQIRKVATGEIVRSFENRVEWFSVEALSYDGQWLVTSGYSEWVGTIFVWDVSGTQQMNFDIGKHASDVQCFSFSPNGRYFAASGNGEDIQIWDKISGFQRAVTFNSTAAIQCAKFVTDNLILAFGKDKIIRQFDVNTKKETNTSFLFSNEILDLHILDATENIVEVITCTKKNADNRCIEIEISYYDFLSNNLGNSFSYETKGGNIALSSRGNYLAVANPEPEFNLALWDLPPDGEEKKVLFGPFNWILGIQFSTDGNQLAASSQGDGLIYMWNLASSQTNGDLLMGHDYMALALAFSPDGKFLVSGGCSQRSGMGCSSGEIRIWDVDSLQLIGDPLTDAHKDWIDQLDFSHDGNLFVSSDFDGVIKGWPIGYDAWINKACQRTGRNFTQAEWQQYFPGESYRLTCPQWPAGE